MTDPRMSEYDDFASYLHNPFAFNFLLPEEKTAVVICKRAERFVTGYYIENECLELLKKFFGNRNELEKVGLKIHYEKLKKYVIDNNKIGVILYGTDIKNASCNLGNIEINKYTTNTGKCISLTIESITRTLIKEYINENGSNNRSNNESNNKNKNNRNKESNVVLLCKKVPLFDQYYNSVKNMNIRYI